MLVILAILTIALFSIIYFGKIDANDKQETIREREYTVEKGNIVVGVETSGLIQAGPNIHSAEAGSVIDEIFVRVGSEVKKGEKLASIDREHLQDQIELAQQKVAAAHIAWEKLNTTKNLQVSQNEQEHQSVLDDINQTYENAKSNLANDRQKLQKQIDDLSGQLKILQDDLSVQSANVAELNKKIEINKEQLDKNNIEIGSLKEKLIAIGETFEEAVDDAKLSEKQEILLQITKLENENMSLQQELDRCLSDPAFQLFNATNNKISEVTQLLNEAQKKHEEINSELKTQELEHQQALSKQQENKQFTSQQLQAQVKLMDEELDKAWNELEIANEELRSLKKRLEDPTIYAQLDGVVTAINYKSKEMVDDSKPVCVIGELSKLSITVPVSASEINDIEEGQKVNINVEAFSQQEFKGTVQERLLVANENGDYLVIINIDDPDQQLLPGMKAYATIVIKEKLDILTLANKAIMIEEGKQYVKIRDDKGELVLKNIVTGFSDGRVSEILDGLDEHDTVIVQE